MQNGERRVIWLDFQLFFIVLILVGLEKVFEYRQIDEIQQLFQYDFTSYSLHALK